MAEIETNVIHCGDNLPVMRVMPGESVDLIYGDPPFYSNAMYERMWGSANELSSFEDRWSGGIYHYIEWMKDRMQECHRLLKPNGSMYLHCDYHSGHYLKVMMDEVFKRSNFKNDIIWKRKSQSRDGSFGHNHDIILYYTKTGMYTFNTQIITKVINKCAMHNGMPCKTAPAGGYSEERQQQMLDDGNAYITKNGKVRQVTYLKKDRYGNVVDDIPCDDIWLDIPNMMHTPKDERTGYPTQKPELLLERIIKASSNEGDILLDPFAGCGTSTAVAQRLGRRWIGIDAETEACAKIAIRLGVPFIDIVGMPLSNASISKMLPHQFQQWVCRRMRARNENPHPENPPDGYNGVDAVVMSQDLDTTGYDNAPVMILNEDGVGVNRVNEFFAIMHGDGKDVGFIVAMSFEDGALEQAAKYKNDGYVDIRLVNAKDIAIDGYFM